MPPPLHAWFGAAYSRVVSACSPPCREGETESTLGTTAGRPQLSSRTCCQDGRASSLNGARCVLGSRQALRVPLTLQAHMHHRWQAATRSTLNRACLNTPPWPEPGTACAGLARLHGHWSMRVRTAANGGTRNGLLRTALAAAAALAPSALGQHAHGRVASLQHCARCSARSAPMRSLCGPCVVLHVL